MVRVVEAENVCIYGIRVSNIQIFKQIGNGFGIYVNTKENRRRVVVSIRKEHANTRGANVEIIWRCKTTYVVRYINFAYEIYFFTAAIRRRTRARPLVSESSGMASKSAKVEYISTSIEWFLTTRRPHFTLDLPLCIFFFLF